jgi:hypothetical protein
MKANKVLHERNPFLLTGKRRWRPFRWIFRRTGRDGAANNLLSQEVKPAYAKTHPRIQAMDLLSPWSR